MCSLYVIVAVAVMMDLYTIAWIEDYSSAQKSATVQSVFSGAQLMCQIALTQHTQVLKRHKCFDLKCGLQSMVTLSTVFGKQTKNKNKHLPP